MIKREVSVEHLRRGMYVVELDCPWLGTPFDFQGFPVTSDEQIELLKRHCKTVAVDPEREQWRPEPPADQDGALLGSVVYEEVTPVESEVVVAREIFKSGEEAIKESFESFRRTGDIDVPRMTAAVSSMTESIQRNPDAMMLLSSLRAKGSHEFGRSLDTSILMVTFGRFLQYPKDRLETLGLAGMLLDVGKTKVPDEVLKKPDMLTPDEYELAKAHVQHSLELIRRTEGLPRGLEEIVRLHHERQDGTGYPHGLSGPDISIDGALAAIVDSFSALTSSRCYAPQTAPSDALSLLHKMRGTLYHEALVEQFIQCIGIYPVGSVVELNTGEVGIVIAQNLVRRLQPRVMVILDSKKTQLATQTILDLVREPRDATGAPYRIRRTLAKEQLPLDPSEFFL